MHICTHNIFNEKGQLAFIQGRTYSMTDINDNGRAFIDEDDNYHMIKYDSPENSHFEEL